MTKPEHAPGYVPTLRYTQDDWNEVSDNPPLTDAELAQARPNGEGLPPSMAEAFRNRGGRPKSEAKAVPVSLRVPPQVLAAYKADGPGWQTRMIAALVLGMAPRMADDEAEIRNIIARHRLLVKKAYRAKAVVASAAGEPVFGVSDASAAAQPLPPLKGSRRLYLRKRGPKSA